MQVFKFGGASVKNAQSLANAVSIIASQPTLPHVVVVSAMAKTTNALETVWQLAVAGDINGALTHLNSTKQFHLNLISNYFTNGLPKHLVNDVNNLFVEAEWLLEDEPPTDADYFYDQLVSIGELVSTKIFACALTSSNIANTWADARSLIITNEQWRDAEVDFEQTNEAIKTLTARIPAGNILVTQGFIGGTTSNDNTTLGREGSDYSAAIFAQAISAHSVTIWKDVPGVLNADPRFFPNPTLLSNVSYQDATEMAFYGATIIHPKTLKPLQNNSIPLRVRSFTNPAAAGTIISQAATQPLIPCFIVKKGQILISIHAKNYSFIVEDNLSTIFHALHQSRLKVNFMLNSALNFSICINNEEERVASLVSLLQTHFTILSNSNVQLLTIRHYNKQAIENACAGMQVLVEVRSRSTCQMVLQGNA